MMARPITSPVEAPSACRPRAAISPPMLDIAIASTLDKAVIVRPTITTGRRPKRSDSGPSTSCDTASPNR